MSAPHNQTTTQGTALDYVRRALVGIRASLAEHGPNDPKAAIPWTLDELDRTIAYIRSVERTDQPAPRGD